MFPGRELTNASHTIRPIHRRGCLSLSGNVPLALAGGEVIMFIEHSLTSFRIDINFDGADVDMVYKEMRARGIKTSVPHILCGQDNHRCVGNKTPIEGIVAFCLEWLRGYVDRNNMNVLNRRWTDYEKEGYIKTIPGPHERNSWDGKGNKTTEHMPGPLKVHTRDEETTELDKIGVTIISTDGLMMGTCHLICEVDPSLYSPQLVQKTIDIVKSVFDKYIRYHKKAA